MPVSLVCSIGWLTREPQLTLHFNGCASSTATLPEMQNPSPANDRQCRSLEFLNDFFVPSLSSLGTFTLHLEARPDPGIYMYTHIYIYMYIPTLCSPRVGSPRIAAYARSCVLYSDVVSPSCAPDCPHVEAKHSNVWEELWDCRTSGWVCRMRSRLRSYLVNFQPQTRLETRCSIGGEDGKKRLIFFFFFF